ncbi:hypothetical protein HPT27_07520 [Permianibacter sp. IMCC34836]|uniref:hypothetical protein n=1 Tax=Permianibacter fluminis TaxID=2738515 RepID=UPI001555DFB4|nr:hypothetical protein [Permianibacter fluminis]NQD36872.1 hypothetical protein [Permianibacter fluminis]
MNYAPTLYLLLLLTPFIVLFFIKKSRNGYARLVISALLSAAFMSGVVIVNWFGYDFYLEQRIAPLDRNGDGIWTPEEEATWTEEDRKALSAHLSDGGRNVFSVFIFPIFSVVYSCIAVMACWGVQRFLISIKSRRLG